MAILSRDDTCDEMRAALDDPGVALFYCPADRFFVIPHIDVGKPPAERWGNMLDVGLSPTGFGLSYCPWTGENMPPHLNPEWSEIVGETFGYEHMPMAEKGPAGLPEEFRTEEWWRKREIEMHPPDGLDHWPEVCADIQMPAMETEPWAPYQERELPGLSRWLERPPHHCDCCEPIWYGRHIMYAYLPHAREIGIRIVDPTTPVDRQPIEVLPVRYCFMCGAELPPPLRPQWEERMRAGGFDPAVPVDPFSTHLPEELNSDKWWRAEGL